MINARTMMTENVITINEDATITIAVELMVTKHVSSLLVEKNNKTIAIVIKKDLIKGTLNKSPNKVKIKDIMSEKFLTIGPDATYSDIVKKLRKEKIKRFPVVKNDNLIGIVTETDVINATRDFTRFHQIMQEIILTVFGLVTAFFLFFFSPLGQSLLR